MKTAKEFATLLHNLGACSDAVKWAHGKTLHNVWNTCPRGDWLLWLVGRMADKKGWPTRQQVVLAACDCAETTLKHVPRGEDRPRLAIKTARAWARGKATIDDANAAAYAASAATSAANAAAYAASAAYAAADAAYAVAYAAISAARFKALAECASAVRMRLTEPCKEATK